MKIRLCICLIIFGISTFIAQGIDKEKLLEYYESQRYADAAQYLQSIYPEDTKDIKALTQMAYCHMMSGKLQEAEKNYIKVNAAEPNNIPVLFSLANINSRRGNGTKAKTYLLNIIQLDSLNFNAYRQLAGFGDTPEARLAYLKKANILNRTDPDVAYDLSTAYRELKRYQQAYDVLKTAIDADEGNFTLQLAKLPLANQLGKYKEVIETGEKLMKEKADPNVINEMGQAYFYLKEYQKCAAVFKTLEDLGIQNEGTLYYMALSYRELKEYDKATEYAKKTIEEGISNHTALYYTALGGIYEQKEQFSNALEAYKRGLTFKNSNTIYYRLGLLYDFNLKQPRNAITYYNLYLKNKPDQDKEKEQIEYSRARITALTSKI
ncbi:Tetratricopeptide repeat-containing protein [Chryseobacterium oleae]|uniref:Tetratricopeptide repeat-containing protein n=1 Tax=Chryseobacterium oleae TaxID=491207 RepID=A0A1I5BXY2_CHROL|nr:CDC27 family protein [Chryseobacterium oleae]SFN79598.1 Tetratricopeptide repeat-containing protein [Chryseobacterium oleae]